MSLCVHRTLESYNNLGWKGPTRTTEVQLLKGKRKKGSEECRVGRMCYWELSGLDCGSLPNKTLKQLAIFESLVQGNWDNLVAYCSPKSFYIIFFTKITRINLRWIRSTETTIPLFPNCPFLSWKQKNLSGFFFLCNGLRVRSCLKNVLFYFFKISFQTSS